jgi:dolichyl-diphosphooligosaccharide--protein glycosyltransferase
MSSMAMYVGMSYVRLELFMSLGMIIMASLGIMYLLQKFSEERDPTKSERQRKKKKVASYVIIVFLLATMMIPTAINWAIMMDRPALILYGASISPEPHNDWLDTLEWIRVNTPEDSKIMAWWDYGYWIQTQSNRTTYMDNGAYNTPEIVENANILTDTPARAIERLQEKEADYVVIYVVGIKVGEYVRLANGGDMAKMFWILAIAERDPLDYYDKYRVLTNHFYEDTLYGSMVPFVQRAEVRDAQMIERNSVISPWTGETNQEGVNPETGQYYEYTWMKFKEKSTGMRLVYASDGLRNPPDEGLFHAVMVYEVPERIG